MAPLKTCVILYPIFTFLGYLYTRPNIVLTSLPYALFGVLSSICCYCNAINEKLVNIINDDRRIHLVPAKINGVFFLRLAICSTATNSKDIQFAYHVIKDLLPKVL